MEKAGKKEEGQSQDEERLTGAFFIDKATLSFVTIIFDLTFMEKEFERRFRMLSVVYK